MTNNYDQRRIKSCECCYNCKHGQPYESTEEHYTFQYCMLDVPQADLDHIGNTLFEDEEWDERFCDIMGVNDNDWLEDSFRLVEPDDVCQFYEREKHP